MSEKKLLNNVVTLHLVSGGGWQRKIWSNNYRWQFCITVIATCSYRVPSDFIIVSWLVLNFTLNS